MSKEFESAINAIRMERNHILMSTDWEVLKSLEAGQTVSESLKKYRQALRDLTEGVKTIEDCDNIKFPTREKD